VGSDAHPRRSNNVKNTKGNRKVTGAATKAAYKAARNRHDRRSAKVVAE
jgi:hypothetical protein